MVCIDINHTTKMIRITDEGDCAQARELIADCIREWELDGYHVTAQGGGRAYETG